MENYNDKDIIKRLDKKWKHLKANRGTWDTHYQELADHILPRKNTITDKKTEGQKRTFQILDNTGIQSNELLAGALHSLLTNPNGPWFELTTGNFETDNSPGVLPWLQQTARNMHNVLNSSNFQTEVHEMYTDLVCFGTGCMQMEEDDADVARFTTRFIADYYIAENHLGFIDEIYLDWKWNAAQIVSEYGEENCPKKVLDAYKNGDETKFCVVQAVYPERNEKPGAKGFLSYHFIPECDKIVSRGKFKSFPFMVPRWTKAAGEIYGRSPGMVALPELKVLNKMTETMLIGAQKVVDPPVQMEDDGVIMPFISRPGGINFIRPGSEPIRPVFNDTRIDFGYQMLADRQRRVKDAYFVTQLQLSQDQKYMTATEVLQRTEESMRLLGPMLGRMQSEFLRPLIDRLFMIMWDRKMIAPPPPQLQGQKVDVRYSSVIARSQRAAEAQSILRTFELAAPFLQLDPQAAINFNADKAVRFVSSIFNAPHEIYRQEDEVEELRAAQAEAQAQAQAAMQEAQDNQAAMQMAVQQTQGQIG